MNSRSATHRCLLLTAVAVWAACADAAVIDVKSSATFRDGLVRLGDIARIDDADPQAVRRLAAVALGPAPALGRKLRITQQTIRERLLAQGVNLADIEFAGQSMILIEGPAEKKAKTTPEKKPTPVAVRPQAPMRMATPAPTAMQRTQADKNVQSAFQRQFQSENTDAGTLKLTVKIDDRDVALLGRAKPESIQFAEPGLEWGGPQTLTAQFSAADGSTQVVRMQAWLSELPKIVTVKHEIPKGQVLHDSDIVIKSAAGGETGIEDAAALIGRETTRTLRPGSPLKPSDVMKTPLVRSNDLVTVRVKLPGLSVSRLFRAQGSGAEGEIVNLVSLENPREKVQARITGWHEAEIVSPEANAPRDSEPTPSRTALPESEKLLRIRGR